MSEWGARSAQLVNEWVSDLGVLRNAPLSVWADARNSLSARIAALVEAALREREGEIWRAAAECLDRAARVPLPLEAEERTIAAIIQDVLRQIGTGFEERALVAHTSRGEA